MSTLSLSLPRSPNTWPLRAKDLRIHRDPFEQLVLLHRALRALDADASLGPSYLMMPSTATPLRPSAVSVVTTGPGHPPSLFCLLAFCFPSPCVLTPERCSSLTSISVYCFLLLRLASWPGMPTGPRISLTCRLSCRTKTFAAWQGICLFQGHEAWPHQRCPQPAASSCETQRPHWPVG